LQWSGLHLVIFGLLLGNVARHAAPQHLSISDPVVGQKLLNYRNCFVGCQIPADGFDEGVLCRVRAAESLDKTFLGVHHPGFADFIQSGIWEFHSPCCYAQNIYST
jgi:hypothetical protein